MRRAICPTLGVALCLAVGACSTPGGPYPSLQPRAAEAIDPRVPVAAAVNERPVSDALSGRLAALVAQARSGDAAFNGPAAQAERLAAAAGPRQSESWIAAQEALTAAIAARGQTARALGDIDALEGNALQTRGGIAPSDLDAIKRAAAQVAAVDGRQSARIEAIRRRLGN